MIKFKEHEGLLFKMLEEHEIMPLKENDANVLVRFITHGVIGEYVMEHWLDCNQKNVPIYVEGVDSDGDVTVWIDDVHHCCPFPMFEIIGTFVKEGSKEWALYQMMQGEKVCHKTSRWDWSRMYNDHAIQNRTAGCMPRVSAWLESTVQSGWQIYEEPKPTFKVGDWVDCKDPVGVPTQCKVLEILEHNVIVECKTGHRWSLPHNNITRKLSPSEIIVNIGCMSGTVKDLSYVEDGIFWFIDKKTVRCPGVMHAILYGEMLDTETRELVEGLLKAQKEEEQDEKV